MIKVKVRGNILKDFDVAVSQSKDKVMKELVERLQENTPVDTGEARDGWRIEGSSIVNDVEHIQKLNEGSSQQAPSHFIEKTLLSQEGIRPSGTIVRHK